MSIAEKIILKENKTLKLNNVLIRELTMEDELDSDIVVHMMESYVKSKGNFKVGPVITYTGIEMEDDELKLVMKIMIQLKTPIHNVEAPYKFKSKIKCNNCFFARFTEKEENLNFAYNKIQLYAFENERKLKGDSYTIFLDDTDKGIVADVFMEEEVCEGL